MNRGAKKNSKVTDYGYIIGVPKDEAPTKQWAFAIKSKFDLNTLLNEVRRLASAEHFKSL